MKNETKVGKTSYGAVQEYLGRCPCCLQFMTLPVLLLCVGGMHCTECRLVYMCTVLENKQNKHNFQLTYVVVLSLCQQVLLTSVLI